MILDNLVPFIKASQTTFLPNMLAHKIFPALPKMHVFDHLLHAHSSY
jgi:hypothetical protein